MKEEVDLMPFSKRIFPSQVRSDVYEIERLYQTYSDDLYRYVFSLTLNHYQTEDIVSQTFLVAIRAIEKFRGDSSIKSWLIGIARHEYFSYIKKNPSVYTLDHVPEMSETSQVDNTTEEVLKLIQTFDIPTKEILILRLINQLSFVEIGRILKRSENYCRVNFFRNRQKLAHLLKDDSIN